MSIINKEEDLLNEFFDRSIKSSDDEFSVCMLCTIIKDNPDLIGKATNLIVNKIKSDNLIHSLRTLQILEECMSKCGQEFQTEVAKYRFLNELIKLVSPTHLANVTPKELRDKIMDCFLLWTIQYPDKDKIRAAYDMLCKQGVIHVHTTVSSNNLQNDNTQNRRPQSFMNKENELKLKQLLQSNNSEDLKRANLFIQFHVNQDAKKFERKFKQKTVLIEIENTANLLIDVLNSYANVDDLKRSDSVINDLFELCEKNKSIIDKMPNITEDSEQDLFSEIFRVNNTLLIALKKYETAMTASSLESQSFADNNKKTNLRVDEILSTFPEQYLSETENASEIKIYSDKADEDGLSELNDIFNNLHTIKSGGCSNYAALDSIAPILPLTVDNKEELADKEQKEYKIASENSASDLLSTIDKISEELFQESLKSYERTKSFLKEPEKRTLNDLVAKHKQVSTKSVNNAQGDHLHSIFKTNSSSLEEIKKLIFTESNRLSSGISTPEKINETANLNGNSKPLKHLSEIYIDINDVTPSDKPPRNLLSDPKGLNITLNFTENKPDTDIIVIVISTINKNSLNIKDFHFEASVPLPCKLFLLPPTGTSLNGLKPFRTPSDLQQILLLNNPTKQSVNITCILSYILGDDPDPIKESIVAKNID